MTARRPGRALTWLCLLTTALAVPARVPAVGRSGPVRPAHEGDTLPEAAGRRPANTVDVSAFLAKGQPDGKTDNTTELRAALLAGAGGEVVFPPGTYVVDGATDYRHRDQDGGALQVPSDTRIVLMPGAVVRQKPTSSQHYKIFNVPSSSSNVTITGGGAVQGDRAEHVYSSLDGRSTHEWGYCIGITGAVDVTVDSVTTRDCTGDGISIHDSGDVSRPSRRVTIRSVLSTHNRRQGMSVVGVDGLEVLDSTFELTNGVAPQNGVDVEPGGFGHVTRNMLFRNCVFRRNAGRGFFAQQARNSVVAGLVVSGGSAEEQTGIGGQSTGEGVGTYLVTGGALFRGIRIRRNASHGVLIDGGSNVSVVENRITDNATERAGTGHGVYVRDAARIKLLRNDLSGASGRGLQGYGFRLNGCAGCSIAGNELAESGVHGPLLMTSTSGPVILANDLGVDGPGAAPSLRTVSESGERVRLGGGRAGEFRVSAGAGVDRVVLEPPAGIRRGQRVAVWLWNGSGGPLRVEWAGPVKPGPGVTPVGARCGRPLELAFDGSTWRQRSRATPDVCEPGLPRVNR